MALPLTVVSRDAALRHAAVRAAGSPSALNTQPWRLHIRDGALWVYADRSRQLTSIDPLRRILTLSLGSAVFGARVALAADGYGSAVYRFPLAAEPDLVAIVELADDEPADRALAALDAAATGCTRPATALGAAELPSLVCARIATGVAVEDVRLRLLDDDERHVVSRLNRCADDIETLDPSYRAELSAWSADDPHHRDRVARPEQCLALVCGADDDELSWLRAGEGMRRALLGLAAEGFLVSPSSQVIEVPTSRAQLRVSLGLDDFPHVLLRAGVPGTNTTRRRRLVDVLVEES